MFQTADLLRGRLRPSASAGAKRRMGCRRGVSGHPDTAKPDFRPELARRHHQIEAFEDGWTRGPAAFGA